MGALLTKVACRPPHPRHAPPSATRWLSLVKFHLVDQIRPAVVTNDSAKHVFAQAIKTRSVRKYQLYFPAIVRLKVVPR